MFGVRGFNLISYSLSLSRRNALGTSHDTGDAVLAMMTATQSDDCGQMTASGENNWVGDGTCWFLVQAGCPSACSGRGSCSGGECQCLHGWSGDTCTIANCTDGCPDHSTCSPQGICVCDEGWLGTRCDRAAVCSGVHNCSGHGRCVGDDVCQCQPGFDGDDCNRYSDCSGYNYCNGQGM